jgi:RNA polymerase sigma-70 factor (ECF subfamily)
VTPGAEPDLALRERSLATAARSGNRHAFEGLVRLQEAALYRFIRRYVGDADEAYDLLQEAFISAWLAMHRFDVRQSFGAWLRAIALNKCRDFGRRHAARRRWHALFATEPTVPGHSAIGNDHEEPSPPESARARRLDRAIADLPRFYKEPLLLTTVGGLTQSQAALLLKTTPKAIEMRIRRARKRLDEALPGAALSDDSASGIAEG